MAVSTASSGSLQQMQSAPGLQQVCLHFSDEAILLATSLLQLHNPLVSALRVLQVDEHQAKTCRLKGASVPQLHLFFALTSFCRATSTFDLFIAALCQHELLLQVEGAEISRQLNTSNVQPSMVRSSLCTAPLCAVPDLLQQAANYSTSLSGASPDNVKRLLDKLLGLYASLQPIAKAIVEVSRQFLLSLSLSLTICLI